MIYMKRVKIIFPLLVFVFLAMSVFVLAVKPTTNSFVIPSHAIEVSKGVFSLGHARDVDGRTGRRDCWFGEHDLQT